MTRKRIKSLRFTALLKLSHLNVIWNFCVIIRQQKVYDIVMEVAMTHLENVSREYVPVQKTAHRFVGTLQQYPFKQMIVLVVK